MHRYLRIPATLSITLAALCASGCSHTVLVHEPPEGGFKLVKPRAPLRATLAMSAGAQDGAAVREILQKSGYFSDLTPLAAAQGGKFDIDIAYQGVSCGRSESPSDTFIGTWLGTAKFVVLTVPTLGAVPPGAAYETDCQQVFAYQFRQPRPTQGRSVQYPYKEVEDRTTMPALYTSEAKEKYQRAYLLDQSVAALLSDISAQLSKE
jgi:hypothetical protein